jgi:hypothetical protein
MGSFRLIRDHSHTVSFQRAALPIAKTLRECLSASAVVSCAGREIRSSGRVAAAIAVCIGYLRSHAVIILHATEGVFIVDAMMVHVCWMRMARREISVPIRIMNAMWSLEQNHLFLNLWRLLHPRRILTTRTLRNTNLLSTSSENMARISQSGR